jgi:hypothetical protein
MTIHLKVAAYSTYCRNSETGFHDFVKLCMSPKSPV